MKCIRISGKRKPPRHSISGKTRRLLTEQGGVFVFDPPPAREPSGNNYRVTKDISRGADPAQKKETGKWKEEDERRNDVCVEMLAPFSLCIPFLSEFFGHRHTPFL
jgi:hypothetical protein